MPQYQGVWTLEQQAQALTNQQWVTDPNFKNTTLLLQADGTGSGSQNQTFLDGSTNNFFITRNGNTTQGSFSPFSQAPGYWGNYFDGTDDDLSIASDVKLTPAAGDFTLECWIYPTSWASLGSYRSVIGGPVSGCMFFGQTSTGFGLRALAVADVVVTTTLPPTNAWTHVAVSRSGTTARLFINGALVSTATDSTNFAQTQVVIANTSVAGTEEYSGYISNLRFVKGTAVYTSAFTPSTAPLTAVTNTQLLICQSNRFVDNSTNAFSLSVGGTPSVQAFGPFAPALQWTPDVVGGSGYFDGTGDYLNTPSSSAFNLNGVSWTIECYVYLGDYTGDARLWAVVSSATTMFATVVRSGTLYITSVGTSEVSLGAITKGQWYHLAFVNVAGTITCYKNGVSAGTASYSFPNTDCSFYVAATPANYANSTTQGYISSLRVVKGTAVYTTTFTPPTAPPTAITNTQLLLNMTNAGIYDGTMNTSWETVGSTQVSTNPVKVGSGSIYFNGTSSQRLLPSQLYPQLTPGTSDFTIECWLYIIGKGSTTVSAIWDQRPGVNGTYINWVVDFGGYSTGTATAPKLVLYADSAVFSSSNVISMAQWNHVALCRANGITRMFINGVLASTPVADTKNYGSGGSAGNYRPSIGSTDGGDSLYGYIDDFRVSRFARYIANFTPPQQALPRQ